MKIECIKDKLFEAISKAEKVTGKNLTLPVLNCILFSAKDRELVIRSTNLDLGIEITLPAKIHKEGVVAVPGNIIYNFISNIPSAKNIIFEVVDGNLKVITDTNTTVIKSMPSDDFPSIPVIKDGKNLTLNSRDFVRGLKSVWYSSAVSSMKPELSSIYIFLDDDSLVFAATDSFRLAEKRVKVKNIKDMPQVLIPVKNIPEILRILESAPGDVNVVIDKNQISFSFDGLYLVSRVVDGVFPDYKQIIPKTFKTTVVLLKQDLVSAFKVNTIFSDKFNKLSVKIRPKDKKFELSMKNADVGENQSALEAVCEGEDLDINFNCRYISDSFQSVNADSVSLEFGGLTKPLVVRGVNDSSFLYLVMPINK
jgi:DNA polymerase-3 subunit beta